MINSPRSFARYFQACKSITYSISLSPSLSRHSPLSNAYQVLSLRSSLSLFIAHSRTPLPSPSSDNSKPPFSRNSIARFSLKVHNLLLSRSWYVRREHSRLTTDGCRSRPWLPDRQISGSAYWSCSQTLTLLFQFSFFRQSHLMFLL